MLLLCVCFDEKVREQLCTSHLQPRTPRGPGNSGDIDFSICKAQVKSLHCRDFVLVKSLLKVPVPAKLLPDSWALRKPQILLKFKPTKKSYR